MTVRKSRVAGQHIHLDNARTPSHEAETAPAGGNQRHTHAKSFPFMVRVAHSYLFILLVFGFFFIPWFNSSIMSLPHGSISNQVGKALLAVVILVADIEEGRQFRFGEIVLLLMAICLGLPTLFVTGDITSAAKYVFLVGSQVLIGSYYLGSGLSGVVDTDRLTKGRWDVSTRFLRVGAISLLLSMIANAALEYLLPDGLSSVTSYANGNYERYAMDLMGNKNSVIIYGILLLELAGMLFIRGWNRFLLPVALMMLLVTAVLSKSATTVLAMTALLLVFFFVLVVPSGKHCGWVVPVSAILSFVLALLLTYFQMSMLLPSRLLDVLQRSSSFTGRTSVWANAWSSIARLPMTGVGVSGNASTLLLDGYPHAHDFWVQTLFTGGIAGLLVFCLFIHALATAVERMSYRSRVKDALILSIWVFLMLFSLTEVIVSGLGGCTVFIVEALYAMTFSDPLVMPSTRHRNDRKRNQGRSAVHPHKNAVPVNPDRKASRPVPPLPPADM
jgi:O-antigen ligase